jgi:hypothetical protein
MVILGSLVIIIGHILFLVAPDMVKSYGEGNELRVSGLFGNPNGLSIFCFLLFPIVLYLSRIKILDKSNTVFLIGLLLFSIIVTGARTALGGVLIFSLYWIANRYSIFIRSFLKGIIPVILFLVATIGLPIVASSDYLSTRLRLSSLESAGGRLAAWEWGYQQVPKNLYFGRGLLYNSYAYTSHFSSKFRQNNRGFNAAFSGILSLLLDTGVVGTLAFSIFIILSFSKFEDKKLVIPLLLSLVLSWTFESWIMASLNPFTILLFIQIIIFQYIPLKK